MEAQTDRTIDDEILNLTGSLFEVERHSLPALPLDIAWASASAAFSEMPDARSAQSVPPIDPEPPSRHPYARPIDRAKRTATWATNVVAGVSFGLALGALIVLGLDRTSRDEAQAGVAQAGVAPAFTAAAAAAAHDAPALSAALPLVPAAAPAPVAPLSLAAAPLSLAAAPLSLAAAPPSLAAAPPPRAGAVSQPPRALSDAPAARAPVPPSLPGEGINTSAAATALSVAALRGGKCLEQGDPRATMAVRVTFAPSGRATTAMVSGGPFAGTDVGSCVARALRTASVGAFDGPPVTVTRSVHVR